jgi:hypothetical protein
MMEKTGKIWLAAGSVGIVALLLGFAIGFVYGHEKRKAINDLDAANGRESIKAYEQLKADAEQRLQKEKAIVAKLADDLSKTRQELDQNKQNAIARKQDIERPKHPARATSFDEHWAEVERQARQLIAIEPEQTEKALKLLGAKNLSQIQTYIEVVREGKSALSFEIQRFLAASDMISLLARYRLQNNVLKPSTPKVPDYKQFAKIIRTPAVSPTMQVAHASIFECEILEVTKLTPILLDLTVPSETEDFDLLRTFPGGKEWIEKQFQKR